MTRTTWISLGLLAALATAGVATLQRSAIATLRQEREALMAAKAEADRLSAENREIEASSAQPGDLEALRAARGDLLGLRNEVQRLREQQKDRDRLRAENQRLSAQIQRGGVPARSITELEGFVAKESWANAGFATPEATLQSFLWSLREGNVQQIAECLRPEERDQLVKQLERMSDDDRQRMVAEGSQLTRGKGYRIAQRTVEAEDRVTLGLQFVADGEIQRIPLRRYGQEWKIEKF
jgi:hypothetical protein